MGVPILGVHEKRFIEARRLVDGVLCLTCGGAELEEMAGLPKRIIKVRLAGLFERVHLLKRKESSMCALNRKQFVTAMYMISFIA